VLVTFAVIGASCLGAGPQSQQSAPDGAAEQNTRLELAEAPKNGDDANAEPPRAAAGENARPLPPDEALGRWLDRSQAAYEKLEDYTCLFVQRERVGDELLPVERAQFRFRKPFMVYMRWVGRMHRGQECLYVEGRDDGKMIAHGAGLLGLITLRLDPEGKRAMRNRRHPITEAGIGHLVRLLRSDYELARQHGEGRVVLRGKEELSEREVRVFECVLPADRRPEYYCHRAVVGFDTELELPVMVSIYDAEDKLLEEYRYEGLKLDVGLSEKDFDEDNPEYGF
jgi:hypothetical protein